MAQTFIEHNRPEWLDSSIFPFDDHRIRISGHEIHFVDEGQGPVLLLLHGNGSWSYGFRLVIPALSKHFRVIAPDYPGFGLSKAAPGFSFKPADQSAVLEAFVDALELHDIRLFVEDWGGPIGLGFAERRTELIHSLIISNTWAWPAQGFPNLERFARFAGGPLGRFLITRFNILTWLFVPNLAIGKTMSAAEKRGYHMPYRTIESRLPQSIFPREILASRDYLAALEEGLAKFSEKPVQIIWGERDPGFGEYERKRFQKHFEHASVLTLPNAKHFVMVDEPIRSVEALLEFEAKNS